MEQTGIPFPSIDPVIIQLGPIALHWYGLAYVAGLLGGWWYVRRLSAKSNGLISTEQCDDFLLWATLGTIVGGRLGYVLFYNWGFFQHHLLQVFALWNGGMAFHGGLLGVIVAMLLYTRAQKIPLLAFADVIAAAAPIGLFFGRIANFINAELWGRTTTMAWGIIFPNAGPIARHPSQLYQAVLEGLLLFGVLWFLIYRQDALKKHGFISGAFLLGYGIARIIGEAFRQPDMHIGFLWANTTMGFWLSLPMIAGGIYLLWLSVWQGLWQAKRQGK